MVTAQAYPLSMTKAATSSVKRKQVSQSIRCIPMGCDGGDWGDLMLDNRIPLTLHNGGCMCVVELSE
jgi:hypothetical protein